MNRQVFVAMVSLMAACKSESAPPTVLPKGTEAAEDPTTTARQAEAKMSLQVIHGASAAYAMADGAGDAPHFPATVGRTPAKRCCEQPDGVCDKSGFDGPTWRALKFTQPARSHYQYEYVASGTGKDATYTARAYADPKCDGHEEVWEISGKLDADGVITDTAARAKRVM